MLITEKLKNSQETIYYNIQVSRTDLKSNQNLLRKRIANKLKLNSNSRLLISKLIQPMLKLKFKTNSKLIKIANNSHKILTSSLSNNKLKLKTTNFHKVVITKCKMS